MTLSDLHTQLGAVLAPDGIPLHYGHLLSEYEAFSHQAVLLDRRHEGRLSVRGTDRQAFLHRMSTNSITTLKAGEACVTLFLTPQGRILERVFVYNRGDDLILISEPGRSAALESLLRRNIFYQDHVSIESLNETTGHFALHGPQADAFMESLQPGLADAPDLHGQTIMIDGLSVLAIRRKPITGTHWALISSADVSEQLFTALLTLGEAFGLRPAGGLAYHIQRVRAGYPAGREVSSDYIPLEVGLWEDLHFAKGCYTGQEIIARMESRQRVARTMVTLTLSQMVDAPAAVFLDGHEIGTLTSSAAAPDRNIFGLAVVKREAAEIGQSLTIGTGTVPALITGYGGVRPPFIETIHDSGSE
jgi:folate-binding protein YgfZ